jgi:plasmid stabilization system protein ParE
VKFTVIFEASARNDLLAAFEWYEARQSGLGEEFLRSVAAVEESLARNPERYPMAHAPYRSAKLRKFPYGLHYRMIGNKVSVLACLHFRQSPERWPGV